MSDIIDNTKITDFDVFFYYGQNDLELETKSDLLVNLLQTKRSLFYDRYYDSAGIDDYENYPEGLTLRINLPFDIVDSVAKRNQIVTNGEDGYKDRRVALSQSTILIDTKDGVKVTVLYIPLANYNQSESLSVPLGR